MKQLMAKPRVLDQPAFEWLDAGASMTKSFFSFTIAIPGNFAGIADLQFDGEVLQLFETGSSSPRKVRISPAS